MVGYDRDLNVGTTRSSSDNTTFPPPRHRLHLGVFAESVSDNAVMTEMIEIVETEGKDRLLVVRCVQK